MVAKEIKFYFLSIKKRSNFGRFFLFNFYSILFINLNLRVLL